MKINFILCCLLAASTSLLAQTQKGTIAVGLELEQLFLTSRYAYGDGNLTVDYFLKDGWSVGMGFGARLSSSTSLKEYLSVNTFGRSNYYFNTGGDWQPFVEGRIGIAYDRRVRENDPLIERSALTLGLGGGIQYNSNKNVSLFVKAMPTWEKRLNSTHNPTGYRYTPIEFGFKYSFGSQKKK